MTNNVDINTRVKFKRSIYLSTSFNMIFKTSDLPRRRLHLERLLSKKSLTELRSIIKLLAFAVDKLPPIYIGITENQSFKQRFSQHFEGTTSLSPGMEKLGLDWDDINFVIFDNDIYNQKNIHDIESLEHLLLKPVHSWR